MTPSGINFSRGGTRCPAARFTAFIHGKENCDGAYFQGRMRWIGAQGVDLPWAVKLNVRGLGP